MIRLPFNDPRVIASAKASNGERWAQCVAEIECEKAEAYLIGETVFSVYFAGNVGIITSAHGENARALFHSEVLPFLRARRVNIVEVPSHSRGMGRLLGIGEPQEYIWRITL